MPRYRKDDWTFFTRKTKSGDKVLYYRTYDSNGQRTTGRSTGTTEQSTANRYVRNLDKQKKLVPVKSVSFDDFTENFWIWGKCTYIRKCNTEGPKSVSQDHAEIERKYLVNHVRPYFKGKNMATVTEKDCQNFRIHLQTETKLAVGSINHVLKVARGVFKEAVRLNKLRENPFENVKDLPKQQKDRGILELDEVRKLLDPKPESIREIWAENQRAHALNFLAAVTGCRRGELLALKVESVHPTYVDIACSWGRVEGVKNKTKNKKPRFVPLPSIAYTVLQGIMPQSPNGFVFSEDGGKSPYNHTLVLQRLYSAFEKIGITPENRVRRNICFHSWRHFFNTYLMVQDVSESKIREAVGHSSSRMTRNYAHLVLKNLQSVLEAQETIIQIEDTNGKKLAADQE